VSNVTVSMKLSLEDTGALYMKSIRQEKRIVELEKNISMLEQYNGSVESLIKDIEAHNLEQRIAGMEEVATQRCPVSGFVVSEHQAREQIIDYAESVRNQAKALKDKS
jgi:acetyl-CoA carboxylase alpha subunit